MRKFLTRLKTAKLGIWRPQYSQSWLTLTKNCGDSLTNRQKTGYTRHIVIYEFLVILSSYGRPVLSGICKEIFVMTHMIRTTAIAALLGAGLGAPALAESAENLVTVVTSENPQTQLMAMVLTAQAMEQGAQTRILLCGPGGDLALIDAPEAATAPQPPRDASPQGMLQMLMASGATVEVCAIYLPGLGADASVLIEGVGVAQPPAMAGAMLEADARVWSF